MQKTFGRRNSPPSSREAYRPSTKSTRAPVPSFKSGPSELPVANLGDDQVIEEREDGRIKSFLWACVSGLTFSIIASGLIGGASTGSTFYLNVVSAVALTTMLPYIAVPAFFLAKFMRLLRVPRGYSDVLAGLLTGCLMLLPDVSTGRPIRPAVFAFMIGGAIGGFVYWRSRGFPGLKRKTGQRAETLFGWVNRVKPWQV